VKKCAKGLETNVPGLEKRDRWVYLRYKTGKWGGQKKKLVRIGKGPGSNQKEEPSPPYEKAQQNVKKSEKKSQIEKGPRRGKRSPMGKTLGPL